jgi:hypothetical protein
MSAKARKAPSSAKKLVDDLMKIYDKANPARKLAIEAGVHRLAEKIRARRTQEDESKQ